MSLPAFSTQSELFSTAALSASLFAETDRYRLFGKLVYPCLVGARPTLEKCYCPENGRVAIEPVLMFGVSILQDIDGVPDRQAVEMLQYHAGWNFALNRQLGDPVFHPTSLVNFRNRLQEHQQSALGFTTILDALEEAGLISRQSRQRLDSTQMCGRIARMNRLDCVRESLRLALGELEPLVRPQERPICWLALWERYVESRVDYRASGETLTRKLVEAGTDAWQLLQWLGQPERSELAMRPQAHNLKRIFGEQFDLMAGGGAALPKEKEGVSEEAAPVDPLQAVVPPAMASGQLPNSETKAEGGPAVGSQPELGMAVPDSAAPVRPEDKAALPTEREALDMAALEAPVAAAAPAVVGGPPPDLKAKPEAATVGSQPESGAAVLQSAAPIRPKGKGELRSNRVQNPHDPDATYAVKGQGQQKKEHVGYKVQVAETVCEAVLAPGEPTRNFIVGIVTHPACESDEAGALKMEQEQAQMGLEKPPVQYVDGAYVSAQLLVQAQAEGREIIGPAQPAPHKEGRFSVEDFQINVEERTAICPAGKTSPQCSRLVEKDTGKVGFRFEFSTQCQECPLQNKCLGKNQPHRTVTVGEHHSALQARRQEQQTAPFKERMKHRNGIEGTQSELVRGHGLRRARYRGLPKVKLQNYFIGAACNVKRWLRREAWQIRQAMAGAVAAEAAAS